MNGRLSLGRPTRERRVHLSRGSRAAAATMSAVARDQAASVAMRPRVAAPASVARKSSSISRPCLSRSRRGARRRSAR